MNYLQRTSPQEVDDAKDLLTTKTTTSRGFQVFLRDNHLDPDVGLAIAVARMRKNGLKATSIRTYITKMCKGTILSDEGQALIRDVETTAAKQTLRKATSASSEQLLSLCDAAVGPVKLLMQLLYHTGARCSDFSCVKKEQVKLTKRSLTIQYRFTKNRRDINDRLSIQYKLPPKTVLDLTDLEEATKIGTAKCNRAMAALTRSLFPRHHGRPPSTFSFRRRFIQTMLKDFEESATGPKNKSDVIAMTGHATYKTVVAFYKDDDFEDIDRIN